MEINKEIVNEVAVIIINGRLDTSNYNDFDKYMTEQINEGTLTFLLDCTNLDYISSSGLRVFIQTLKTLNENKGKLAICGFNENIKDIFTVSGFTKLFNIFSTKADALKSFA
jgi:anti-anti-sigma factor